MPFNVSGRLYVIILSGMNMFFMHRLLFIAFSGPIYDDPPELMIQHDHPLF